MLREAWALLLALTAAVLLVAALAVWVLPAPAPPAIEVREVSGRWWVLIDGAWVRVDDDEPRDLPRVVTCSR